MIHYSSPNIKKSWKPCTNPIWKQIYEEVWQETIYKGYKLNNVYGPFVFPKTKSAHYGASMTYRNKVTGVVINTNIGFNTGLVNDTNINDIRKIIIHEIAHAVNGNERSQHDAKWEKTANDIGMKWGISAHKYANDYGLEDVSFENVSLNKKYFIECPNCHHEWSFVRMCESVRNPGHYMCGKCKIPLIRKEV